MIFLFYAIQMQELFEIKWPEVDKEHLPQTHALFFSIKSRQKGGRYVLGRITKITPKFYGVYSPQPFE